MDTALLLLAVLALFFVSGYGPVVWLADRDVRLNRALLVPVVGFAYFLCATHALAAIGLVGSAISWAVIPLLLAPAVTAARHRWIGAAAWREAAPVFLLGIICVIASNWPLLLSGYRSYMGYSNQDAAFNSAIFSNLLDHPYAVNPSGFAQYWPSPKPGVIFGGSYFAVWLATIFHLDILYLHQIVTGPLAFLAPLGAYLLARSAFGATRRQALFATFAVAGASQLVFTVCLQSLGSISLTAMLPALLACWNEAARSGRPRLLVLASLAAAGTVFAYYASLPILAAMCAASLFAAVWQRFLPFKKAVLAGLAAIVLFFAVAPPIAFDMARKSLLESGSSRLQASLDGSEILLTFAFALTEWFLPFFWGLGYPQWSPAFYVKFSPLLALTYFVGLALCVFAAYALWAARRRRDISLLPFCLQLVLMLAGLFLFELKNNGYGVFKMAAWWSVPFWVAASMGLLMAVASLKRNLWLSTPLVILGVLGLVWNWQQGAWLAIRSVYGSALTVSGSYRLNDFVELRQIARFVPPQDKLLVVIDERIVQDWVLLPLHRFNLAVNPVLIISGGPDDPPPYYIREPALRQWDTAKWILTFRSPQIRSRLHDTPPVWENGRFRLYRRDQVTNLIAFGEGWYPRERMPNSPLPWQHDFRWLRKQAELMVLFGDGSPFRLQGWLVPNPAIVTPTLLRWITPTQTHPLFEAPPGGALERSPVFRAHGALTTLKLESDFMPPPPARGLGILRRWVPVDGRRLTVAFSRPSLLDAANLQPDHPVTPPQSYQFPLRLAADPTLLAGFYSDGWIGPRARATLTACGTNPIFELDGHLRGDAKFPMPFPWTVTVNGQPISADLHQPGDFHLTVPAPSKSEQCGPVIVEFQSETIRSAPKGANDPRPLAVRITAIKVKQPTADTPANRR
ncbi:MAG: hypothetical protein IT168_17060 [Bryobacterales bacterium]|nr:hypothetical protein [Bryobacterales bacterium]